MTGLTKPGTARCSATRRAIWCATTRVGTLVDWPLMEAKMWSNTSEEPDRMERRMAEFLVHRRFAWDLIIGVAAIDERRCRDAEAVLATVGVTTAVRPRQEWYF